MEQEVPPDVPAGLPSSLLERRPDIRAAEQSLIAANANIGVAKAAYFPQLTLSGLLGGQSTQLSSLFSGPHSAWSFRPASNPADFCRWPPEVQCQARGSRARQLTGAVRKDDSNCFYGSIECHDCAPANAGEPAGTGESGQGALQDRKRLAYVRYRGGVDTQLNALDADRDLFQAQFSLAQIRLQELLSVVQLYKALGGGWQQ